MGMLFTKAGNHNSENKMADAATDHCQYHAVITRWDISEYGSQKGNHDLPKDEGKGTKDYTFQNKAVDFFQPIQDEISIHKGKCNSYHKVHNPPHQDWKTYHHREHLGRVHFGQSHDGSDPHDD